MTLFRIDVSGDDAEGAREALAAAGIMAFGPVRVLAGTKPDVLRVGREVMAQADAASADAARARVADVVGPGFEVEVGVRGDASSVTLGDAGLELLVRELAGQDVDVRSPVQAQGPLGRGGGARDIDVGGTTVAVPDPASVSAIGIGYAAGVLIRAGDPKPHETWIWIRCEASGQANHLMRQLGSVVG
jgi:hypothetical protein